MPSPRRSRAPRWKRTRAATRSVTARSSRSARRPSLRSPSRPLGLVLAIRADLRDDRGELTDLEAQGATPRVLRRVVAARATLVAVVGAVVGALSGIALAFLVTKIVSVTARADAPEPPLATTVDPLTLALGAAAFAAAAAALVVWTTRRAFADPRGPGRIGGEA